MSWRLWAHRTLSRSDPEPFAPVNPWESGRLLSVKVFFLSHPFIISPNLLITHRSSLWFHAYETFRQSTRDLSEWKVFSLSLGSQLLTNRARMILVLRFWFAPSEVSHIFSFLFPLPEKSSSFLFKKTKKNDSETYSARQTSRDKNDFGVSLRLSVSLENCELFLLCNMFKNQKKKKESVVCLGEDVFEVTSVKYQRTENTGGWVQAPLDFFF